MTKAQKVKYLKEQMTAIQRALVETAGEWPAEWEPDEINALIMDTVISRMTPLVNFDRRTQRGRQYKSVSESLGVMG